MPQIADTANATFASEEDAVPALLRFVEEPDEANLAAEDEDGSEEPTDAEDDESEDDGAQDETEDDSDEADDEPADAAPKTFKVKVDGEEVEVTEQELLAGYSRDSDYRKKTQALAEERRTVLAEKAKVAPLAQEYLARLNEVTQALQAFSPQDIDWDRLRAEDPQTFAVAYADFQRNQEVLQGLQFERQQASQQLEQMQSEAFAAHLQEQQQRVADLIPEWKDPSVASAGQQALAQFAMAELGFSRDEIAQVYDARLVKLLHMAQTAHAAAKAKPAVKAKAEQIVKSAKPGPAAAVKAQVTKTKVAKVRDRVRRTGSIEDATEAILSLGFHK